MNLKSILVLWLACSISLAIQGQHRQTETLTKKIPFTPKKDRAFYVENINGSIDVEGYDGNTIQIEVKKTIEAKNEKYLQRGVKQIGLEVVTINGNVHVYMESPYSFFDKESGDFHYQEYDHRNRKNFVKRKYQYHLDFKIKVPRHTNVDLHTINNGNIDVKNVHGQTITAKNINGAITLQNVTGKTEVDALNRDIKISYAKNPTEESWYRSLNGDIHIKFQKGLQASVSHRSMNGSMYTNFDITKVNPTIRVKRLEKRGKAKYKIKSKEQFLIGDGGVRLHFSQLNGDATLESR